MPGLSSVARSFSGLRLCGVVGLVVAGGCTLNRSGAQEVSTALERYRREQGALAESYARTAPRSGASAARTTQATPADDSLKNLRDFIVHALEHNPEVKAAEEDARANVLTTKTLPEPIRTAEGDNFFILGLRQKLPVPGKLDRAGRIALAETRMAIEQLEQTRLRVIADVKRAYFQLYIIDRTLEITADNQDVLRGLIEVARGQVAAGKRQQQDVLRAQVELSSLEARLIELRRRRTVARAMLNTLMNRRPTRPIPAPLPFGVRQVDVQLDKLLARGKKVNPQLRRFERRIERDRQAVELARLAYWPDFTVGFEWMEMEPREPFGNPARDAKGRARVAEQMSEDGSDNWAITLGFNLPIWLDKIEAGIREAKGRLAASRYRYTSARNGVYFEIEEALTRVRAQQELAEIFDTTIIPQARQTYEVSRSGYAAGVSDFQYVIDNWQKWLMFTIQYHRAIGELERGVADLEQAIGLSLAEAGGAP
ncbi:MAG: TolC family protein [Planctomycetota bacterium]|jgi:outer membrane protein TolC